jgi:molybdate transport system substrate-binding protein
VLVDPVGPAGWDDSRGYDLLVRSLLSAGLVVGLATAHSGRPATNASPPVAVAAAADLQSALPPIAAEFERETGRHAALTFGSSGNFYTQIQHGAPFDVFLSADIEYPHRLEAAGLAEPGSLYEYATGRLVLWVRTDSGLDVRRGLALLADASVRRIAVANPAHAPYGRAALAALQHEGLYEIARTKLVLGENISQAAQFAQSGNAEAGIIALSLALAPGMKAVGRYYEIAAGSYPPIAQGAIVIRASKQKALARQLVDYLKTPAAKSQLESFGFAPGRP